MTGLAPTSSRQSLALSPSADPARYYLALALVAVTYYVGAELGLTVSLIASNVTPLWPSTGIAVAAFLLAGRSMWPGVALAALAVNLPITENALAAVITAAGNTLAPLLAVILLERVGFRRQLDRQQDALAIVFVGALPTTLLSATIGTAVLLASGAITSDEASGAWAVWWTGDAMGVLTVAPFLLCLPLFWELPAWSWARWLEAAAILGLAAAMVSWAVNVRVEMLFLTLPLLGWASWRLQLRGAAPAALLVCVIATEAAAHGNGAFADDTLSERMLTLQSFNACVALTSFFLAALVTERMRAAEALEEAAAELEDRVARRTADLSAVNARLLEEIHGRSEAQELLSQEEARSHRERRIAETLQRSLLPERLPQIGDITLAARHVPGTNAEMGGDWYDVIELPERLVGLVIGDVPGHGPHTTAAMVQLRMALRAFASRDSSPKVVMAGVQQLVARMPLPAPVNLTYLVFDPTSSTLRFANAGNPAPLIFGGGSSRFLDDGASPALGVSGDEDLIEIRHEVPPGATLVLYSRRLVERRTEPIELGLDRLLREVTDHDGDDIDELCDHILSRVAGSEPAHDDITLLAMRPQSWVGGPLDLTLPAEPDALVDARRALRHWLGDAQVTPQAQREILIAVGEACANVVRHAYRAAPGTVAVHAHIEDEVLEVTVRDLGTWRPPFAEGRGTGLQLIDSLMDSLEVDRTDDGTVVTMRRSLRGEEELAFHNADLG